ncbi:hypothetical protein [Caballeronia sp. LZ032]|uniref:hypothetical protein n=1 Tax=Caballeronia sp. LZ032 TaxID=3038565 RepID=UPI002860C36F|nr:hypothetical protein [Caballeronia sp. LZ032]MDR5879372.1 hypothetical protein [Caballeronia sp. LZ032]
MVRTVELIEREYEAARAADRLGEWGTLPLLESEELVVMSVQALARIAWRVEEAERELDKRLIEESFAWFESLGYTEEILLSPEDFQGDGSTTRSRATVESDAPRSAGQAKGLKTAFAGFLGTLFARRSGQAG